MPIGSVVRKRSLRAMNGNLTHTFTAGLKHHEKSVWQYVIDLVVRDFLIIHSLPRTTIFPPAWLASINS